MDNVMIEVGKEDGMLVFSRNQHMNLGFAKIFPFIHIDLKNVWIPCVSGSKYLSCYAEKASELTC